MKMSNIKTLILLLVVVYISGCKEDFLEVIPTDKTEVENFYNTDEQMLAALTAAYSNVGDRPMYGSEYFIQKDVLADHVITAESDPKFAEHYNFNFNATRIVLRDMWHSLYKGIYRSNRVLAANPQEIDDSATLARIEDEARFLRAYYYWHLLTMWREFPLRTEENFEQLIVLKSTRDEVYAFLEQELQTIITNDALPLSYSGGDGEEIGRVTMGAVHALFGKVLLYQQKYDAAAAQFTNVLDGPYTLVDDPEMIWHLSNENNTESIFEVQFCRDCWGENAFYDDGGNANEGTNRSKILDPSVWFNLRPSEYLMTLYDEEPGDLRRQAFIRMPGELIVWEGDTTVYNGTLIAIKKGISQRPEQGLLGNDENFPLIRLADIYLMLAEALHLGTGSDVAAMEYVDLVRMRAFKDNFVSTADLMASTNQDLMTIIKKERSKELAFEGHRFNDLRRWGDIESALGDRYVNNRDYYPIPQEDIDKSGGELTQDPNY